jgi:uncharacterized membrane protein (DUF106 family)
MVFDNLLSPILDPLLVLDPLYAILVMAFTITFLITVAYKFLTDQEEMKRLKDKMQSYQEKMKEAQQEDPDEALDIQKEAMSVNMEYMKHSLKPTLFTFIPIIIIFGWMSAHLNYHPIAPGEQFNVTAEMVDGLQGSVFLEATPALAIDDPSKLASRSVTWNLRAEDPGSYTLQFQYGNKTFTKDVLVSDTQYLTPSESYEEPFKEVRVGMDEVEPLPFSIFGWNPGWLATYIIFSIIFSMGLRKLLRVS